MWMMNPITTLGAGILGGCLSLLSSVWNVEPLELEFAHMPYLVHDRRVAQRPKTHRFHTISPEEVARMKALDEKTMAFWVIEGRDPDLKSPPPFHVVVRVGERVYDFDDKPGSPRELSAAEFRALLLKRADRPTAHEVVFSAPPDVQNALHRHYRGLLTGKIQVDGKAIPIRYHEGGFARFEPERLPKGNEPVEMNCFSWVFTAWQEGVPVDPVLRDWLVPQGLSLVPREGANPITVPEIVGGVPSLNVLTWGADAMKKGFQDQPGVHIEFILRRFLKIRAPDKLIAEGVVGIESPRPQYRR